MIDDPKELSAMLELAAARVELSRLREDLEFHKRLTDAWGGIIINQEKEAQGLRRDLKEAVYLLAQFGFCIDPDPDLELLLVERRRKLLERHP